MDATEALELRTSELPRYVSACEDALHTVAEFGSSELLDALFRELACLEATAELRALPETRLHRS